MDVATMKTLYLSRESHGSLGSVKGNQQTGGLVRVAESPTTAGTGFRQKRGWHDYAHH
jgi:hypothetical protein